MARDDAGRQDGRNGWPSSPADLCFGVGIGYTQGGVLVWGVFAPTANLGPGALSGNYIGATGSATVGAGANVLVGGSSRTISLQPVSIEGNTGLNVAAGIGSISLRYQPQVGHRYRP